METKKVFKIIKKVLFFVVLIVLVLLFFNKFSKRTINIGSSSSILKIVEVEKFNVAKFTWSGIAEYHKDDSKKVDTYIRYDADIIATMDLKDFDKNVKIEDHNIIITLPEITLKPNVIFEDEGKSFSFIPDNSKIEMKELIRVCEEDAIQKVSQEVKIHKIAEENAKSTIKGLLLPLLEDDNYEIVWKDGE